MTSGQQQIELLQSFLAVFGRPGPADPETLARRQAWIAADEAVRLAWLGLTRAQAAALGYQPPEPSR